MYVCFVHHGCVQRGVCNCWTYKNSNQFYLLSVKIVQPATTDHFKKAEYDWEHFSSIRDTAKSR